MPSARLGLLPILLATGACSLASRQDLPVVPAPAAFKEAPGWVAASGDVVPAGNWWTIFAEPRLDALEARIEASNQTLAAAIARYDQALATVRRVRSEGLPQVGVEGDVGRERVSANRPIGGGVGHTYNDYRAGASLSFELDVFGRIRNSVRASAAVAEASAADVAAVRLGLQAQLAGLYFDLRGIDARVGLLRKTVTAFQRAYILTSDRHDGGIGSGLDVSRAEAQLSSAHAELNALVADRARTEHAIAVLVGASPSGFSLPVDERAIAVPTVPAIVPSVLLQHRPDIMAAENRVAEANARIGVARAAIFPAIGLGGAAGFETTRSDILRSSSSYWALGPLSAMLSVFDGGARRANVRISRAEYEEAAANYRQIVLEAFREVEDDLAAARQMTLQEADLRKAADAANRTRMIALDRYRDGASDYLEVVTAQAAALDATRTLLIVRAGRLGIAADTARAMGGIYTDASN